MKSLFSSKTFWVNLLTGVGTVTGFMMGALPPEAAPIITGVQSVANIALRVITCEGVTMSGGVK